MKLQQKTIEKLRQLINEETEYRTGPQLVSFFNSLGFKDKYGQGFPSRWIFTEDRLKTINGTVKMEECIILLFSPINFLSRLSDLDKLISDFNQYLLFDGFKILRNAKNIKIVKGNFDEEITTDSGTEEEFIRKEFKNLSLVKLCLDGAITDILTHRIEEIRKCLTVKSPLSVIFLCGSTLEGILLGIASKNPSAFNQSRSSPKDQSGKVKQFHEWTLGNFIDVARDQNLIGEDVMKFSHALRDFRNYIHPYQQMSSRFNPDEHTAKICWQVLQAAIYQLSK